jgi:muramidase (phage lysozyme)
MISPALKNLLDKIGSKEAPEGYGQIYGGAKGVSQKTDVSKLKLKEVRELQATMLAYRSASTACGRYQFIRNTLIATMTEMHLSGEEVWAPELQDRMAIHLMEKRGLKSYLAGAMTREVFANNLAKEWASLPVVTRIRGAKRMVAPGETYYAGDGLNKAHHDPAAILKLVDALLVPAIEIPTGSASPPPQPPASPPSPAVPPRTGLWAWFKGLFT